MHAEACGKTSSRFAPATVTPPDRFLRGLAAARAGVRNPIELWDRELFGVPAREMRRFGGKRFLEVTDPTLMHQVLVAEADAFTRSAFQLRFTRPLVGGGILAATGDAWKTQRRAAAPCFRHQAVEALAPAAAAAGACAVETLRQCGEPVDLLPVMMRATFDVVAELLGVEAGALDQTAIDQGCDLYLKGVGFRAIADIFKFGWLHRRLPLASHDAIRAMQREAARAVGLARTQKERTRLLGRLADAFAGDPNAERTLRDSVIAFIAAGYETSGVALTWALYLIAHDPIVQRRLAEESQRVLQGGAVDACSIDQLDLHLRVIKETLRLFPPIALMQRTATRAVQIGDHQLAPGDEVVCAIYVMHRSARVWDRPNVFDPERFTTEATKGRHRLAFMPFGAGPHACLGMPLALMEMVAILATLTQAFHFGASEEGPVLPIMRLTLRPDKSVRLIVRSRDGVSRVSTIDEIVWAA